jgi:ribosomal protein L20
MCLQTQKDIDTDDPTKEIGAKVAVIKAGVYAFTHRKDKKNDMRKLWTVRIERSTCDLLDFLTVNSSMHAKN